MRMLPQHESHAFSAHAEKLYKFQWDRDRRLTGEIAAHVGRGLPIQPATILKERHGRGLSVKCSEGHDLEGLAATAHDAQQGLCVGGVGITSNGNFLWLCQGIKLSAWSH
jgi:hypothetical protein